MEDYKDELLDDPEWEKYEEEREKDDALFEQIRADFKDDPKYADLLKKYNENMNDYLSWAEKSRERLKNGEEPDDGGFKDVFRKAMDCGTIEEQVLEMYREDSRCVTLQDR